MALPLCTSPKDIKDIAKYLITKPTGATLKEIKAALGSKIIDGRRLAAFHTLNITTREGDHIKLTSEVGRGFGRATDDEFSQILLVQLGGIPAYRGVWEWAYHKSLVDLPVSEVGAHWHDNFRQELGTGNDTVISYKVVCFLQLSEGARLGRFIMGRRGQPSRLVIDKDVLEAFIKTEPDITFTSGTDTQVGEVPTQETLEKQPPITAKPFATPQLGKSIFIGHGKNKKPLEQLKKILEQFKIQYKVAIEEPNLGRPISDKIRATMQQCNCAILVFTPDEEFTDKDGNMVYRPSENVSHELGAAGYLYDNRIVIMKEEKVDLPSNFKDIGYIQFSQDQLEAKTMEILKELIAFGIIQFTT